jgi:mRNA interferase MazF
VKILQGDIYWVDFGDPLGSEAGYTHPAVVVQSDVFNKSAIKTVVVREVTETLKLGKAPGNVTLLPGEANLRETSVVNVSLMESVDKKDLGDWIGRLRPDRVQEILNGIRYLLEGRPPVP